MGRAWRRAPPGAARVAGFCVTLAQLYSPTVPAMTRKKNSVDTLGAMEPGFEQILSPEALAFVAELHRSFNARRLELLGRRRAVLDTGGSGLDFDPATRDIRDSEWQVAPVPNDLRDRRVEITAPVDRRMMINALNSGARVFMADMEDSKSPLWEGMIQGQVNLRDAVRRELRFTGKAGRQYRLHEDIATLVLRPRGLHLPEAHVRVDGEEVSGALFDFGLYFFHNAAETLARDSGPYFYLPKLEHYLEARWWNDVFKKAQDLLGIPQGSVRVTVMVETVTAAFCMDEMLYQLRDHVCGLNAGRWDYIFSFIKHFRERADHIFPDRSQVTMTVPAMRAYTQRLVAVSHRRGAHAIGGMAAFIPSRKDPAVNETAIANVRKDKERELADGFDGTWVSHPDLVPVVADLFERALGGAPHQKHARKEGTEVGRARLLNPQVPGGKITERGIRKNVSSALQYIDRWLCGIGAAAIDNLMEDTATAEVARAQLWQWIRHGAVCDDGAAVTAELYKKIRAEELKALGGASQDRLGEAAELLDSIVLDCEFAEFLTPRAYRKLIAN